MTAISISSLKYTWPGAATPTLDVPEFEVARGESVFLRGASGSGKSTLLNLMSGILATSSGSVKVLDVELAELSVRKRDRFRAEHIGIVFQQFNLIPFLTVGGNLRLAARFAHQANRETDQQARSLVEALQLHPDLLEQRADRLSVGQQQRVAIARAFINKPDLILADEPTSALDADARDHFVQLLLSIRESTGCAIVFASHDDSLADFFERRVVLNDINKIKARELSHV